MIEPTYPLTFPTMCFLSSHSRPRYCARSSTGLLSPFVSSNWFGGWAGTMLYILSTRWGAAWRDAILFKLGGTVGLQDTMHDGYCRSGNIVDNNIAIGIALPNRVCQKQDVPSGKCRFHRFTVQSISLRISPGHKHTIKRRQPVIDCWSQVPN